MNYQEAREVRNKSYISGITEKLIAGHGLGSSVVKTISEKSKARNVGLKEKFDPLNIVKFMTGGSKLAPALLGRMMGRSQQDIKYFSGEPKVREERQKATKIDKLETDNQILSTLLQIYQYMKKTHEDEVSSREKKANQREEIELEKQKRHKELIEAITGRKDAGKNVTATPIKEPEKEGGLFGNIFSTVASMIAAAIASVSALVSSLSAMVNGIVSGFKGLPTLMNVAKFFISNPIGVGLLAGATLLQLLFRDKNAEETNKGITQAGDISTATQTQLEANKSFEDLSPEDKKKEKARIVKLNDALKDAPTATKLYNYNVPQYLKSKGYSPSEIDELITPVQDRVKFQGPETDPTKMNLTPKTPADVKPVTTVPTGRKLEVMPSVPPSEELNAKVKESVTLNLPAATPKSVKESQVINNTNVVNTNKPMAPKNPLPSVRNTEKSFSEMIFYSTRVV